MFQLVHDNYVYLCSFITARYMANPLFPPGVADNVDTTFDTLPNGDLNATVWIILDGECQLLNVLYEAIPDERFRAYYTTDTLFFTTGTPFTISFFSCNPEDYVIMFVCHDRSKEIVRNGRRVYCDGPHEILFIVYEYPPDRVNWCNTERDLWINYRLSIIQCVHEVHTHRCAMS